MGPTCRDKAESKDIKNLSNRYTPYMTEYSIMKKSKTKLNFLVNPNLFHDLVM